MLQAIPYVLQGLSALGGIFGRKKQKYIDPETLRRLYGPEAIGKDTTELAQRILNSPYGQQLLSSAAEQGQTIQNEMNSRAAAAGLSPDTGGQSGASDFATSAAAGAQSGLERQARAGVTQAALPVAAGFNQSLMEAALMQNQQANAQPGWAERIGAAAGQTAATLPAPQTAAPPSNAAPVAAPTTASNVPTVGQAGTPLVAQPVLQPHIQPNEFSSGRSLTTSRSQRMMGGK